MWARARIYIARHPVTGVGMGNFPVMEGQYIAEIGRSGKWSTAHNSYYQAAVELGVLGGALFLTQVLLALRRGWRVRSESVRTGGSTSGVQRSTSRALRRSRLAQSSCLTPASHSSSGIMALLVLAEGVVMSRSSSGHAEVPQWGIERATRRQVGAWAGWRTRNSWLKHAGGRAR
ncbi:MAG: O-antigen ligase family protein [Gemmatimonadetes bacterium]|nr:O-antigen ligase family protein [Gemmatimonadota bacterium]